MRSMQVENALEHLSKGILDERKMGSEIKRKREITRKKEKRERER